MKSLKLSNSNLVTYVDDHNYDKFKEYTIYLRRAGRKQYAQVVLPSGATVGLHTLILKVKYPFEVDHRDGDGLNNFESNLRAATHQQNHQNQEKQRGKYKSAHVGVSRFERDNCWRAYATKNGKQKHLGYFRDEISAARAYNRYVSANYGEFAKLNEV